MPHLRYNHQSEKREYFGVPTWDEIRTSGRYNSGETETGVPWYRERSRSSIARSSQPSQQIAASSALESRDRSRSRSHGSRSTTRIPLASGARRNTRQESIPIDPRLLAADDSSDYTSSRYTSPGRQSYDRTYFTTSSQQSFSDLLDDQSNATDDRSRYQTELTRASVASSHSVAPPHLYSTSIHRNYSDLSTSRDVSISQRDTNTRADQASHDGYRSRFSSLQGIPPRSTSSSAPRAGTSRRTWEDPDFTWDDF